jgi:hypothetical protein
MRFFLLHPKPDISQPVSPHDGDGPLATGKIIKQWAALQKTVILFRFTKESIGKKQCTCFKSILLIEKLYGILTDK